MSLREADGRSGGSMLQVFAAIALVLLGLTAVLASVSAYYLFGSSGSQAGNEGVVSPSTSTFTSTTSTSAMSSSTTTSLSLNTTSTIPPTTVGLAENQPQDSTTSTATTLRIATTTLRSPYSGKGYRMLTLDITIPSPHCEQHLTSTLSRENGIIAMDVKRRAANNTIIYNPKAISMERILELTASIGDSQLLEDVPV